MVAILLFLILLVLLFGASAVLGPLAIGFVVVASLVLLAVLAELFGI